MWTKSNYLKTFYPGAGLDCSVRIKARRSSRGAALFIAIAMLALFSLLGVSYVRFLMVEQDLNTLEIRKVRAKYYAEAGIQSGAAQLQETLSKGQLPVSSTTFTFPVYGFLQGTDVNRPSRLDLYRADVSVQFTPLTAEEWQARDFSEESYPGDGCGWFIESSASVLKKEGVRERSLSRHSLASVLAITDETVRILSWHTCR